MTDPNDHRAPIASDGKDREERSYTDDDYRRLHAQLVDTQRQLDEERDGKEAYEAGIEKGISDAVQEIDRLTGGDGEYVYCMGGAGTDRHCPGPTEMKERIVARYLDMAAKLAIPPASAEAKLATIAPGIVTDEAVEAFRTAYYRQRCEDVGWDEHLPEYRATAAGLSAALPICGGGWQPIRSAAPKEEGWTKEQLSNWLHDARSALIVVDTPDAKAVMEKISIEMLEALGPSPAPSEKGGR